MAFLALLKRSLLARPQVSTPPPALIAHSKGRLPTFQGFALLISPSQSVSKSSQGVAALYKPLEWSEHQVIEKVKSLLVQICREYRIQPLLKLPILSWGLGRQLIQSAALRSHDLWGVPAIRRAYSSHIDWRQMTKSGALLPARLLQMVQKQASLLRAFNFERGYSYRRPSNPDTVLYSLIAANVGVWLLWQSPQLQPFMEKHFLASVDSIRSGRLYTAITANFSHADGKHLLLNMITLFFFGRNIAYQYGGNALLGLYLAGGLGCTAAYYLYWTQYVPRKQGYTRFYDPRRTPPALGASGSVTAILMCSILSNPFQIIYINLFIPVPAILFGAFVVYSDLHGAMGLDYKSRVGYSGHLGGAAAGALGWAYLRHFRFR